MFHLLTLDETSDALSLSRETCIRLAKQGVLPGRKLGTHRQSRWVFDGDALLAYIRGER